MELELKMKKIKTSAMLERLDDSKDEIGPVSGASRNTVKGPKMPCFEETQDDMDSFLHRFEIYAKCQNWPKDQWAVYLLAEMPGSFA